MPLVLKSKGDSSADEFHVLHGELRIGRIYKRKAALRADARWLWALNCVPGDPRGLVFAGLAPTLHEAAAAMQEGWFKWLASKELPEAVGEAP
jgi:hypothetical protein